MMNKIQFALFFPAFFLLYSAGFSGSAVLGYAGTALIIINALLAITAKKKK